MISRRDAVKAEAAVQAHGQRANKRSKIAVRKQHAGKLGPTFTKRAHIINMRHLHRAQVSDRLTKAWTSF